MATNLQSFDESPLGAFFESDLGVRGLPSSAGRFPPFGVLVMIWIDEASVYVYDEDLYLRDLRAYQEFVNQEFFRKPSTALVHIPGAHDFPDNRLVPDGFPIPFPTYVSQRPVAHEDNTAAFNIFSGSLPLGETGIDPVLILIEDLSGSMGNEPAALPFSLTQFVEWVEETHPDTINRRFPLANLFLAGMENERFLAQARLVLESVFMP